MSITFTWDAEIVTRPEPHTFTWDAMIGQSQIAFTWDTVIEETRTQSFTWDALLQAQRTFTWDTFVVNTEGSFRGTMSEAERDALEGLQMNDRVIITDRDLQPIGQIWNGVEWMDIAPHLIAGLESGQLRKQIHPTLGDWRIEMGDPDVPLQYTNGVLVNWSFDDAGNLVLAGSLNLTGVGIIAAGDPEAGIAVSMGSSERYLFTAYEQADPVLVQKVEVTYTGAVAASFIEFPVNVTVGNWVLVVIAYDTTWPSGTVAVQDVNQKSYYTQIGSAITASATRLQVWAMPIDTAQKRIYLKNYLKYAVAAYEYDFKGTHPVVDLKDSVTATATTSVTRVATGEVTDEWSLEITALASSATSALTLSKAGGNPWVSETDITTTSGAFNAHLKVGHRQASAHDEVPDVTATSAGSANLALRLVTVDGARRRFYVKNDGTIGTSTLTIVPETQLDVPLEVHWPSDQGTASGDPRNPVMRVNFEGDVMARKIHLFNDLGDAFWFGEWTGSGIGFQRPIPTNTPDVYIGRTDTTERGLSINAARVQMTSANMGVADPSTAVGGADQIDLYGRDIGPSGSTKSSLWYRDGAGGFHSLREDGLYALTSDFSVANTTAETEIGHFTIPGRSMWAGATIRFTAWGDFDYVNPSGTFTLRFRGSSTSGTTLLSMTMSSAAATRTNDNWWCDVTMTCRADYGSAVTVALGGLLRIVGPGQTIVNNNTATLNLSTDRDIYMDAVMATANAANVFRVYGLTAELVKRR